MSDIFISYDKANKDLATQVAQSLEAMGFAVWWDRHLGIGTMFNKVINQKLDAAKAVIVIWTKQSIESQWVYAEAAHADRQNKLVPIRADDIEPSTIPIPFNLVQTAIVGDMDSVLGALASMRLTPAAGTARQPMAATATLSSEEKLFQDLEAEGTIEAYEYYLTRYPSGSNVAVAEYRLHKLKRDKAATNAPAASHAPQDPARAALPAPILTPRAAGRIMVAVGADNQETEFDIVSGAPQTFRDDELAPLMVIIPPGSITIGSPATEIGHQPTEEPQRLIEIKAPFAISRYQVTFDDWTTFAQDGGLGGYNPDDKGWGRGRRPVINVSCFDALAFVDWLTKRTGKPYRLPSESEWEYAARAGTVSPFSCGESISPDVANYDGSRAYGAGPRGINRRQTVPVGSFPANAFGLHDMHGNVREWVQDIWVDNYKDLPADGSPRSGSVASQVSSRRVVRGGSWYDEPGLLRSAARDRSMPDLRNFNTGFRIARTLD